MPFRRRPDRDADAHWAQVSELIAERMGLHFPRERLPDLQRGLETAGDELGFENVTACADWLLSAPPTKAQLQVLASHLTIGETYFLREKQTFEVLSTSVLPALIHARRGRDQRLRLWSAACCSGEEAYSLAILLHQLLPDLADWHVTILATDINARFLRRAVAGSYSEWSFRDTPAGFKERYFNRSEDKRYAIRPEIKKLVTFEHLNLVEDVYPSLVTDPNAMDLIFCRNVLMYFTSVQARKVIGNLHHALIDGGWLAVSPSETSQALFPQFLTQNFPGVVLYQKSDAEFRAHSARTPMPRRAAEQLVAPAAVVPLPPPTTSAQASEPPPAPEAETLISVGPTPPPAVAASLYEQGRYDEAAEALLASFANDSPEPRSFSLLARALANQGRLADALAWCERWIAADKLDAVAHFVRAAVLLEHGRLDQARRSLQRVLYLDPNVVLAHFALGNLARSRGKDDEAEKHFANALRLLDGLQPDDVLLEADGLTAGRLTATITAMTALESAR